MKKNPDLTAAILQEMSNQFLMGEPVTPEQIVLAMIVRFPMVPVPHIEAHIAAVYCAEAERR